MPEVLPAADGAWTPLCGNGKRQENAAIPLPTSSGSSTGNDARWWLNTIMYQVLPHQFTGLLAARRARTGQRPRSVVQLLTDSLPFIKKGGYDSIWLPPIFESPRLDFGYDVSDYEKIDPTLGTMRHWRRFVQVARRLGIKINLDLPINHCSVFHRWFLAACNPRHPQHSKYRAYFLWKRPGELRFEQATILFKDYERSNWQDPVQLLTRLGPEPADAFVARFLHEFVRAAGQQRVTEIARELGVEVGRDLVARLLAENEAEFFHRFYFHQADLNHDNPAVEQELYRVVDHMVGTLGADMMRMDAAPHFVKVPGTSCESLPETHRLWERVTGAIHRRHPGIALMAEVNGTAEDVVSYLDDGFDAAFDFVTMMKIFEAIARQRARPLADAINKLRSLSVPDGTCLMLFLRLHDEVTWEFLSRSARQFLWRHYGDGDPNRKQNWGTVGRLYSLLKVRRLWELAWGLLHACSGPKLVYYGDELGIGDQMKLPHDPTGRMPDYRDVGRNAFPWSCEPQDYRALARLYPQMPIADEPPRGWQQVNVPTQEAAPDSELAWSRRLNELCRELGDLFCTAPARADVLHEQVLLIERRAPGRVGEDVLIAVVNLSDSAQGVEIDLRDFAGGATAPEADRRCLVATDITARLTGGEAAVIGRQAGESPLRVTLPPGSFLYLLVEEDLD